MAPLSCSGRGHERVTPGGQVQPEYAPETDIAKARITRMSRIVGLLAVIWVLALLHLLGLMRGLLPGNCGLARLERRWLGLWMR
jgi:hypothetical protein